MLRTIIFGSAWIAVACDACLVSAQERPLEPKSRLLRREAVEKTAPELRTPRSSSPNAAWADHPFTASPRVRDTTQTPAKSSPKKSASLLADLGASAPFDFTASGAFLAATVRDGGGLALWATADGKQLRRLENSDRPYSLVAMSEQGRWVAGVRQENNDQIDLWRTDNGRHVRVIDAEGGPKQRIEFRPESELRVTTASGHGLVISIPKGIAIGGFDSATGGSALKQPAAQMDAPAAGAPASPSTTKPRSRLARPSISADRGPMATESAPSDAPPQVVAPKAAAPKTAASKKTATKSAPRFEPRIPPEPSPAESVPSSAAPPDSSARPAFETFSLPAESRPAPSLAPQMAPAPLPGSATPYEPSGGSAPPSAASPAPAPPPTARMIAPRSEPAAAAPAESAPSAAVAPFELAAPAESAAPDAAAEPGSAAESSEAMAPMESAGPFRFEMSEESPGAPTPAPATAAHPSAETSAVSNVHIHYATNRNRLTPKDRQWVVYFFGFFTSTPAFVIYGVVFLVLLIFPWIGQRSWTIPAVLAASFVLCSMGLLEAYVRSQLRNEMTGELFGCRPTDLAYGKCVVSVPPPKNRHAGDLSRPVSLWIFNAPEDADQHFMLRQVEEHKDKEEFYRSISQQMKKADSETMLLFIHGYNVSFEDAIFRTAQLAVDLKFPGAPVTYCWPSYADPVKYTFDEQNAEVSIPALGELLNDLTARSGAKKIHIIAHSMGNRVLAGALSDMDAAAQARNKQVIHELVLAAPDIDSRVFRSQVLPHIVSNTQHCTLYASSHDRALFMSRRFHNFQRLGETRPELVVAREMDTIDASMVDTSLLGHSYIGDAQSIVSDLHDLVVGGKRAIERVGLTALELNALKYWSIQPDAQAAGDSSLRR